MANSRTLVTLWSKTKYKLDDDLIPEEWVYAQKSEKGLFHRFKGRRGTRDLAKCDLKVSKSTLVLDYTGSNESFNIAHNVELGTLTIHFEPLSREVTRIVWRDKGYSKADEIPVPFGWIAAKDTDSDADEGGPRLAMHRRYERNRKLREEKISRAMTSSGELVCEACDFDFRKVYGNELGEGFCEVHHKVPLSETGKVKNSHDDLAILCANCHRMIHRSLNRMGEMLSVDQLKALVGERSAAANR